MVGAATRRVCLLGCVFLDWMRVCVGLCMSLDASYVSLGSAIAIAIATAIAIASVICGPLSFVCAALSYRYLFVQDSATTQPVSKALEFLVGQCL